MSSKMAQIAVGFGVRHPPKQCATDWSILQFLYFVNSEWSGRNSPNYVIRRDVHAHPRRIAFQQAASNLL